MKKLVLKKEVIVSLSNSQMSNALGGAVPTKPRPATIAQMHEQCDPILPSRNCAEGLKDPSPEQTCYLCSETKTYVGCGDWYIA